MPYSSGEVTEHPVAKRINLKKSYHQNCKCWENVTVGNGCEVAKAAVLF